MLWKKRHELRRINLRLLSRQFVFAQDVFLVPTLQRWEAVLTAPAVSYSELERPVRHSPTPVLRVAEGLEFGNERIF